MLVFLLFSLSSFVAFPLYAVLDPSGKDLTPEVNTPTDFHVFKFVRSSGTLAQDWQRSLLTWLYGDVKVQGVTVSFEHGISPLSHFASKVKPVVGGAYHVHLHEDGSVSQDFTPFQANSVSAFGGRGSFSTATAYSTARKKLFYNTALSVNGVVPVPGLPSVQCGPYASLGTRGFRDFIDNTSAVFNTMSAGIEGSVGIGELAKATANIGLDVEKNTETNAVGSSIRMEGSFTFAKTIWGKLRCAIDFTGTPPTDEEITERIQYRSRMAAADLSDGALGPDDFMGPSTTESFVGSALCQASGGTPQIEAEPKTKNNDVDVEEAFERSLMMNF